MKILLETARLDEARVGDTMGVGGGVQTDPPPHLLAAPGPERFLADGEQAKKELGAKAAR